MINSVRETVHDFLEKNNRGWLKPERFNNYAYLAQMEIFESYVYDYGRWVNAEKNKQIGGGYANIPSHFRQKLDIFYKEGDMTYQTAKFVPPVNSYRVIDVFYGDDFVDEVTQRRARLLNKSNLTAPSEEYPIYVRLEDQYVIYPDSINSNVTCGYLRKPLDPKWTFNVISGNPVFNPSKSDFQDFEIHSSDEPRLVVKILEYAGVSIREQEVVSYAEMQEQQKKQNETRL